MIRANLLEDDGRDAKPGGMLGGILAALAVILLCVGFIFLANQRSQSELDDLFASNQELQTSIDELSSETQELEEIEQHEQEVQAFINTLQNEQQRDHNIRGSIAEFAPWFTTNPDGEEERAAFDTHDWNDEWSIQSAAPVELGLDRDAWVLNGQITSADDLAEIARRQAAEASFESDGLEALTVAPIEYEGDEETNDTDEKSLDNKFAFRWVSPMSSQSGEAQ